MTCSLRGLPGADMLNNLLIYRWSGNWRMGYAENLEVFKE
jgi:hypothetical protein